MSPDIRLYTVFGNPIAHSKSPQIHALFAEQLGIQLDYGKRLAPEDGFAQSLRDFAAAGGCGANVTVPFKEQAFGLCSELSPRAQRAGAVNTLVIRSVSDYFGDNTDGAGLFRDLCENLAVEIEGRSVLVLGAGGAVRGVLEPLLRAAPKRLVVANRTLSRAESLVEIFSDLGQVSACGFPALDGQGFDLVINGTAASLQGQMPDLPEGLFRSGALAYDMMYGADKTPFLRWAQDQGVGRLADGLGMLVEQAAEAFEVWHRVRPDTAPVIRALRDTR